MSINGLYVLDDDVEYTTDIQGQLTTTNVTWIIKNFITLLNNKTTRELRTRQSADKSFQCRIQFQGRNNDLIEIYYLSTSPVFLKYTLICNNEDDGVSQNYHVVPVNKWQFIRTLAKSRIDSKRNDQSFRFKFYFVVNHINVNCCSRNAQISNDYENLLQNGLFTDVTMKSTDETEYKVHKAVLASRSAVLRAHFEHDTTECLTNVVESPLDSEVLGEVVTFIYTDKAQRVNEMPEKLLAAAEYYQLTSLKIPCEEALHKKLTVENAMEMLQLADLHSATTLKQLILEYMKDGQLRLITKTEGWAKVKSVELIKGICEYITADAADLETDIE